MAQDAEEHQAPAIPFRNTEGEGAAGVTFAISYRNQEKQS